MTEEQVTLVFNGEIYNFLDLREELSHLGSRFKTKSDTEVLLKAYLHWGESMLSKLRGMFAFAIFDKRENKFLAARDPIGKKPLYYAQIGDAFWFSSELLPLKPIPGLNKSLSGDALKLYLSLGYIPAPFTIYQGVHKLKAGEALTVKSENVQTKSFWELPGPSYVITDESEALEKFSGMLTDAVQKRMVSDVPLGAFLSGGIDSNLVVATMKDLSRSRVKTLTFGFPNDHTNMIGVRDERELAARSADFIGTDHREVTLDQIGPELIPKLVQHLGEPLADASIIPTYLVCHAAQKSVTVALTGDGGDEPFGGYSFRYLPYLRELKIRKQIPGRFLQPFAGVLTSILQNIPKHGFVSRALTLSSNLAVDIESALLRDLALCKYPKMLSPMFQTNEVAKEYFFEHLKNGYRGLNRLLYADVRTYMVENVLVKADRMSMANSLELRSPLLDQDLVSFAFQISESLKIKGTECKYLLRRQTEKLLPQEIAAAPKTGFSFHADQLIRSTWKNFVQQAVFQSSLVQEIVPPRNLTRIWSEFQSGNSSWFPLLWAFFILGVWESTE